MKIVKNTGQCSKVKGKYILCKRFKDESECRYAEITLKNIAYVIWCKLRYRL